MVAFSNDQPWNWDPLDHSSAATLLSRHLPNIDPTRLRPYGSGDFCIAFKLADQVIRVARHREAAAALERETCVLAEIAGILPLPVPRLTYHSPRGCPPFTTHNEIVGAVLTQEIWENMPVLVRRQAAADLAGFLRALHSTPVGRLNCRLAQIDAAATARRLRETSMNTIYAILDQDNWRQLDTALESWSLSSQPDDRRPVLLHCDIGPGHVLYDPQTGALTGVIDFGDVAIGDPARDFIYVYEDFGPVILKEVLNHYAGNDISEMIFAIRKWYLLEAISWTVRMCLEQCSTDMKHGLQEIKRELASMAGY